MPQWLGCEGFDVAIPGAGATTHIFGHTESWVIAGRPGMKAESLQQKLQSFQAGRSKSFHLRAQIRRWLLEGKRQIKLMEDAFKAHLVEVADSAEQTCSQ